MDDNYIVRMRDAEVTLVGPFENQAELVAWGRHDQRESDDDPRWQSVRVDLPTRSGVVVVPVNEPDLKLLARLTQLRVTTAAMTAGLKVYVRTSDDERHGPFVVSERDGLHFIYGPLGEHWLRVDRDGYYAGLELA